MESTLKAMAVGFLSVFPMCIMTVFFEQVFGYKPPFSDFGFVLLGAVVGIVLAFSITYFVLD